MVCLLSTCIFVENVCGHSVINFVLLSWHYLKRCESAVEVGEVITNVLQSRCSDLESSHGASLLRA